MNIVINIFMFCALSIWGGLIMMSPMMFATESYDKELSSIYTFAAMLLFPVPLLMIMSYFDYTFLSINSIKVATFVAVIAFIVLSISGSFTKLLNLHKGINNSGYTITDSKIYHNAKVLEQADIASFAPLSNDDLLDRVSRHEIDGYATDENHVYYNGKVIENFSPKNARFIALQDRVFLINNNQVLSNGRILAEAIPDKFNVFEEHTHWAFSDNNDGYHVYYSDNKLPNVDKNSFELLSYYYAKDVNNIYKGKDKILEQADAKTFQILSLDDRFAFDKNNVFFINTQNEHTLDGVDYTTLMPLKIDSYVKDKDNIYHVEQYETIHKLAVDYNSFVTHNFDATTQSDANDKTHYFHNGKVVGNKQELPPQ